MRFLAILFLLAGCTARDIYPDRIGITVGGTVFPDSPGTLRAYSAGATVTWDLPQPK